MDLYIRRDRTGNGKGAAFQGSSSSMARWQGVKASRTIKMNNNKQSSSYYGEIQPRGGKGPVTVYINETMGWLGGFCSITNIKFRIWFLW